MQKVIFTAALLAAANALQCTDVCVQQCQDSSNQEWKVQACISKGCSCSTNDLIPSVPVPINNIAVDLPFLDVSIPTQKNNIAVDLPFLDVSIPTNNIPHLQCTDWCVAECQDSSNQQWKVQLCIQKACSCGTNDLIPSVPVPMNNIAVDLPFLDVSIPTQRNNIVVDVPFLDINIPTNSDCEDQCAASSNQDFKVQACITALCNSAPKTNGQCQDWCLNSCDGNPQAYNWCVTDVCNCPEAVRTNTQSNGQCQNWCLNSCDGNPQAYNWCVTDVCNCPEAVRINAVTVDLPFIDVSIPTNDDCEDQCTASSNQVAKQQACIKTLCNSAPKNMDNCADACLNSCDGNPQAYNWCVTSVCNCPEAANFHHQW